MTSITLEPRFVSAPARPPRAARPRPAAVAAHQSAPVHLTRRGRLVVFVAALVVVLAAGLWIFGGSSAATEHPQPTRVVVVGTGQTLWDIAADVAPGARTGDTVARIQRLNHLGSGMVMAGQRLVVPVGS